MRAPRVLLVLLASVFAGAVTLAQVGRGGSEWLTAQADAQRTSWIRTDAKISVPSMSAPGFERQWTSRLDNKPRQLNGLMQGVTANGVTLFVPMSVVTGSANTVYAIDNDTGYVVWKRQFEGALPAATAACAGGITAAATRIVPLVPPPVAPPAAARGRGGAGYRSVVGEPGQGVPVEGRRGGGGGGGGAGAGGRGAAAPGARAGAPARGAAPVAAAPQGEAGQRAAGGGRQAQPGQGPGGGGRGGGRGNAGIPGAADGGGPGGGLGRPSGVVYVVAADGVLHVLGLQSGKDIQKPGPFLPANARWSDTVAVGTMLYAATSGNCGGAPDAVWAVDLDSEPKPVVSWRTNGGPVVGPVAFATDGTLIAAIGPGKVTGDGKANAIVALDPHTLQLKDWFTQAEVEFVTGPTVFQHGGRDLVAAGTRDGRVLILDAASLGGANHATPLQASRPVVSTGGAIVAGLATWQEITFAAAAVAPAAAAPAAPAAPATATLGTRWILVPFAGRAAATPGTNGAISTGGVVALRFGDAGGTLSLEPGWTSHNLTAPATPITVNGVVFALSTGRPAAASAGGTAAVLHAYDGMTGKALWNSGKAMTAFASPGSYWSAMGQVYVGTNDGTLHAFGFLDERR
jgi:outer membrane protein assembly factor BamB